MYNLLSYKIQFVYINYAFSTAALVGNIHMYTIKLWYSGTSTVRMWVHGRTCVHMLGVPCWHCEEEDGCMWGGEGVWRMAFVLTTCVFYTGTSVLSLHLSRDHQYCELHAGPLRLAQLGGWQLLLWWEGGATTQQYPPSPPIWFRSLLWG